MNIDAPSTRVAEPSAVPTLARGRTSPRAMRGLRAGAAVSGRSAAEDDLASPGYRGIGSRALVTSRDLDADAARRMPLPWARGVCVPRLGVLLDRHCPAGERR